MKGRGVTHASVGSLNDPSAILTANTSEEQRQYLRKQCRESLYFLCKAVLGFKDFTPAIHLRAANIIQDQTKKRKLIMLPRSFFKSYLCTIGYPIWLLIQEPDNEPGGFRGCNERILIANATATNAEHFLDKIKSVFERNTLFQWLFPELIPDFTSKQITWNTTESSIPRTIDYPEPTFSAAGVGAAIVSRHFTRIILDDLINEKHAESPELMRKAISWYTYAESLLEVSGVNEQIVIGTRWAFNDLYSYIEETEGEWSPATPLGYKKHIRHAIENDKPIFPERFDFKELQRLRSKLGDYMFSCLYLNNPRQPGVNDFDTNWLQYYTFADKGKIALSDGTLVDPNDMDRILLLDIATSIRKDADFSAICVVGVLPNRRIFLLDAWHAKVTTKNLLDAVMRFAGKWHVRTIYYEDSAQQKLIQYPLEERIRETGHYFPVKPVKAVASGQAKTKEQRIRMLTTYFQQGRVFLRESMTDFIKEFQDFPLGKHDDLIDSFAYFPRVIRFSYDDLEDPEPLPGTREYEDKEDDARAMLERRSELNILLNGRSPITGY